MSLNRVFSRVAAVLVVGVAGGLLGATSATARPDDDVVTRAPRSGVALPLERIGDQFVRGDNLTGAGAPAPSFVPEAA